MAHCPGRPQKRESEQFAKKTLHICPIYVDYAKAVYTADFIGISVLEGPGERSDAKVSYRRGPAQSPLTAASGLRIVRKAFRCNGLQSMPKSRSAD